MCTCLWKVHVKSWIYVCVHEHVRTQDHHKGLSFLNCTSIYIFKFIYSTLCMFFLDVCAPCAYYGPHGDQKRTPKSPRKWNCRWLWVSMWVLRIGPKTSARATSALTHGPLSPAPPLYFIRSGPWKNWKFVNLPRLLGNQWASGIHLSPCSHSPGRVTGCSVSHVWLFLRVLEMWTHAFMHMHPIPNSRI